MGALDRRTFFGDPHRGVLAVAVIGSLLLHVTVLLLLPMLREVRFERMQPQAAVVARLAEPPKIVVPTAFMERKEPIAPTPASAPLSNRPTAEARLSSLTAASVPVPRAAPSAHAEGAAKAMPQSSQAAPVRLRQPSAAPAPLPAASDVPDAGTIAQYRLAVLGAAKRYKDYPPIALENRWQGRVEIHVAIGVDGSISSLKVRSSTGHSLLDAQAIDMIRRAQAAAEIPPALLGRQFVVDVPVEFALREPGA